MDGKPNLGNTVSVDAALILFISSKGAYLSSNIIKADVAAVMNKFYLLPHCSESKIVRF